MAVQPATQVYSAASAVMNRFGSDVNIPEMGLLIQMERSNILSGQVKDQFADMQKRNEWLKQATDMLNDLRARRPASENGKGWISNELHDFLTTNGVKVPVGRGENNPNMSATQFDNLISSLKASIDTVNTNSQMDMVRMQGLMDKLNQSFDFMTNWISKNDKSLDSIIGNIR
ncbi:MAG: hypothetical protein WDN25_15180 [Acetobacteraceae bacterium]